MKTKLGLLFVAIAAIAVSCAVPPISAQTPSTAVRNYATPQIITQTALGASAVFTQPWVDSAATGQKTIEVSAYTDQAGTFIIQASNDANNSSLTSTVSCSPSNTTTCSNGVNTVSASTLFKSGSLYIGERYWRVVYTNGSVAQTQFEIVATASQMARDVNVNGAISATVGTPTVVPSCPASAYPCGLPTPNPLRTAPVVVYSLPPPVQPSPLYTSPVTTPAPCSTATCSTVAFQGGTWTVNTPAPVATVYIANTPAVNVQNTPAPYATATTLTGATSSTIVLPSGLGACSINTSSGLLLSSLAGNAASGGTFSSVPVYDATTSPPWAQNGQLFSNQLGLFSVAGLYSLKVDAVSVSGSGTFNLNCVPNPLADMPNVYPTTAPNTQPTTMPELPIANCAPGSSVTYCQGIGPTQAAYIADMCASNPLSYAITTGSPDTAILVASGVSGKVFHVCRFSGAATGTGLLWAALLSSTSSTCASGNSDIFIGGFVGSETSSSLDYGGWDYSGSPVAETASGSSLCLEIGATTLTSLASTLRYVRDP